MLDWDEANLEHIARHRIRPKEVEEALLDPRRIGVSAYNVEGERRWAVIGATEAGRVLFVIFTRRSRRRRVVAARDADRAERRRYGR